MEQLNGEQKFLHLLMREGTVGSNAFKQAVEKQLLFFEEELCIDLVRLAEINKRPICEPESAAKAITRLIFAQGAAIMDLPEEQRGAAAEQMMLMVRMILVGAQTMASHKPTL